MKRHFASFVKVWQALALGAAGLIAVGCSTSESSVKETGELKWPEITQQTKPWSRWWWPASATNQKDISYMLDEYSTAGLGGLEITPIYGVKGAEDKFLEFLSPEWMEIFKYTLDEARKHDIGIDLANASGWPFGGPWVTPDFACRYLASKIYHVKGGEGVTEKIEYIETPLVRTLGKKADISQLKYPIAANDSLQQYAFEQVRYPLPLPLIAVTANSATGDYVELTDKVMEDGTLDWTAPEGDWTVCALFLGWHGKMVERAGPGGEGDVIDHFSGDAITRYLKKFDDAFKGYDLGYLRYYFNDSYEVDDAMGNSDWTENFFNEFKARRGYDLKPHMAELLGESSDTETSDRVVFDYRRTINDLLLEKYSTMWQQWAAKQGKGIRNQAHGSPANILDLYGVSDVPETEGRTVVGMKTASSAAHVKDKPLTSSESATWLNEHFRSTLGDVKTALDIYLLAGVNHIFYHGTCLSPKDAMWPGWMFYASVHFQPTNSFWTDFAALNKYVARCQSFLQAGRPDNDILLFFDATDLQSERGREPLLYHMNQNTPNQSAIGKSATYLYEKGYTWDYITDKMICEDLSVSNGLIETKGGNKYQTIIIPQCDKMLCETFGQIVKLAKQGATVLVEGALPADVPGLENLEVNRETFNKLKSSLKFNDDNGVQTASCGKGRIIVSDDLDAMIECAGITRETMFDLGMQSISRTKDDGGKYYFVKNATQETFEGWLPIDVTAQTIGIYNPMSGELGYGNVRDNEGRTEVFMKIQPDQSFLLETFAGKYSGESYKFYDEAASAQPFTGEWSVTFVKGGPELPEAKTVKALSSWTAYGKPYEIFSGTAEYKTTLPALTDDSADAWMMDFGTVCESAAVYLNGEYIATLFSKPFAVTLTKEQAAKGGELVVAVSNSMENRISYMDRTGIKWRIFYNTNFQSHSFDSHGPDGYFSAAGWSVQDSGLLGPVTITPLKSAE